MLAIKANSSKVSENSTAGVIALESDLDVIVSLYEKLLGMGQGKKNDKRKNIALSQKSYYYWLKLRLWFLAQKLDYLEKFARSGSESISVPSDQVYFDKQSKEVRFMPAFDEALCDFYESANQEILIFTPDFSSAVFSAQVVKKLANIVSRGVVLRIIVKNSDSSRQNTSPKALEDLKLELKGIPSDKLNRLLTIQVNTGVPERLTRFLDSCSSAFSVVDRKHFRYRMLSEYVLDAGIFVFNAAHSMSSGLLINSLVHEVFIKASEMIDKYQR